MKTAILKELRKVFMICAVMAFTVLTAGCGKFTFEITTMGNNSKIEIKGAENGDYAETNWFSVGKGKIAVVDSSLDKGELKIEFAEVSVYRHEDSSDEVIVEKIAETVTVKPGEKKEVSLDPGEYILQITAMDNTNGTVTVNIEKP